MNRIQEEKSNFVGRWLKPTLVAATGGYVKDVAYEVEGHEEFVTIIHSNGYKRRACVTGDSLMAVIEDTMKLL